MKKLHLVSTAMLIPTVIFAEINFHLSISNTHSACEYEVEADYVDDGDPWFEECESSGPSRVSFEYQWAIRGGAHVLRYRKVTFHTINNSWIFGPWMIKANYCHHSCKLHHNHVFYRPVVHTNWHRVYNRSKKVYVYEYRGPGHDHHKHTVYRHEYKPVYKKSYVEHDKHRPVNKQHEKHYNHKPQKQENKHGQHQKNGKHYETHKNDKRSDNQSGKLNKNSSLVKKEQKNSNCKSQQNKIVLVSGRNR